MKVSDWRGGTECEGEYNNAEKTFKIKSNWKKKKNTQWLTLPRSFKMAWCRMPDVWMLWTVFCKL